MAPGTIFERSAPGCRLRCQPGVSLSAAQVSQATASVDPNLPVVWTRPLDEQVAAVFRQQRLEYLVYKNTKILSMQLLDQAAILFVEWQLITFR